jgi:hypothetical protein
MTDWMLIYVVSAGDSSERVFNSSLDRRAGLPSAYFLFRID